jgi:hypothetical protein
VPTTCQQSCDSRAGMQESGQLLHPTPEKEEEEEEEVKVHDALITVFLSYQDPF